PSRPTCSPTSPSSSPRPTGRTASRRPSTSRTTYPPGRGCWPPLAGGYDGGPPQVSPQSGPSDGQAAPESLGVFRTPAPERTTPMSRFLHRLGRTTAAHPWRTLAAWLALTLTVFGLAFAAGGTTQDDYDVPGIPSRDGQQLLAEHLPT